MRVVGWTEDEGNIVFELLHCDMNIVEGQRVTFMDAAGVSKSYNVESVDLRIQRIVGTVDPHEVQGPIVLWVELQEILPE